MRKLINLEEIVLYNLLICFILYWDNDLLFFYYLKYIVYVVVNVLWKIEKIIMR